MKLLDFFGLLGSLVFLVHLLGMELRRKSKRRRRRRRRRRTRRRRISSECAMCMCAVGHFLVLDDPLL